MRWRSYSEQPRRQPTPTSSNRSGRSLPLWPFASTLKTSRLNGSSIEFDAIAEDVGSIKLRLFNSRKRISPMVRAELPTRLSF